MENSIVVMDGSLCRSGSTSKFGSLVQINSIAIDISSPTVAIDPPQHEHFTIRGFVAGMRKKDLKKCFPFASEGDAVDVVKNLPPIYVPRFQCSQCSNCIPDTEAKRTTEETVMVNQTDSCHNVGDKISLHSRESTGNKLRLRENDQSKHIKKSKLWLIGRHKASTCNEIRKTDIKDKEAGEQANPLQIVERSNNSSDASDMLCVGARLSCEVDHEPDNASSESDGTLSALPQKRKPKVRSLADIMVKERNPSSENPTTRSTSSSGAETEAVLGPQPVSDVTNERKRHVDLGEDEGCLDTVYGPSAKRIKVRYGGKTCRRMEISDSESERDASMRLTQRIKTKKTRALDVIKKMRQTHGEDGAAPMRKFPPINANLQKYNVPRETSFGKFRCAPSGVGEMRPGLSSEVGANHDALMPPRKSNLGDCNMREKVALDLSLNSYMDAERNSDDLASVRQNRGIPDLNEESPEKTAMTQGQRTTLSEERIVPLHKTSDIFTSCINGTTREGKRHLGISEPKSIEHELGGSDDIPMEIVELLAQNQRERALENSTRRFFGINNSRYSAPCVDQRPGVTDFPLYRTNGLTMANGSLGVRQNFPQLNKEESQFRLFGSSAPSQPRKSQFAASSSITAVQKSSTEPDLLWSPMTTRENSPSYLTIAAKHSIQPSYIRAHSFSDRYHKGKTVSNVKDGKEKRAVHNIKDRRMGPVSTSMESLDPYSNDTIPAMQLLSLMDQRAVSGSSFEVGTKSFSPCNHHPRLNGKKNQNVFSGSFFTQNRHSEGFSGLRYGAHCSGESSNKDPSSLRAQIPDEFGKTKAALTEGLTILKTQPVRNESALGVCTLNRNPADFSIPESRNEFTLSAKDFTFRKRDASKERSRMVNVESRKRPRIRKDPLGKESSRK